MNKINILLIIAIIIILSVFSFMFFYLKKDVRLPPQAQQSSGTVNRPPYVEHIPVRIVNQGKEAGIRDKAMEDGVLKINSAASAYFKDNGEYPESRAENLCLAVRLCLKQSDINKNGRIYLNAIPQVGKEKFDYYYRADNQAKSYCIKTPRVLETASTTVFQCNQNNCSRTEFKTSCE